MIINATKRELVSIGISESDSELLSENRAEIFQGETNNRFLSSLMVRSNATLIYRTIADKKTYYLIPKKYIR